MILLGLEVGARASEVCRLTVCCWIPKSDGTVYIAIKLAKNGKNGKESGAVLVRGEGGFQHCMSAIAFFEEYWFPFLSSQNWGVSQNCTASQYRTAVCLECSPMFPVCVEVGRKPNPVSRAQVTEAVKKWAERIGRDSSQYSAISFRRGSVSIAAAAKVDRNIRKKHARWKSEEMQDIYTEVSKPESQEFGKAIRRAVEKSRRAKGKKVRFTEFET